MNETNEKRIKEKIDFFISEKVKVHIEKKNREFLNGILIKKIRENVWLLEEDKLGKIYVFLSEIYDINQYRKNISKKVGGVGE